MDLRNQSEEVRTLHMQYMAPDESQARKLSALYEQLSDYFLDAAAAALVSEKHVARMMYPVNMGTATVA